MTTAAAEQALEKLRQLKSINFIPHSGQQLLFNDPHRFKVIRSGRRWGKTIFAINLMVRNAVIKGGDYWYVSPTYRQSKDICWRTLFQYLPASLIAKKNESELSVTLKNGSMIALKGADSPDSLRGVGLDGCILDEYAFMSPEAWNIISPMLQDRKGWAVFISTPDGYNHFYDLYIQENTDKDFKSFHFTSYDNPYLDKKELDKEKLRMTPEKFEREYLAEFTKRSGVIWPDFSRDTHCVDRRFPSNDSTIMGSIDFGFAQGHETACLWHEITPSGIYTFDGFNVTGKTIQEINELMREQTKDLNILGIYPDPARPDLIEELRRNSWPILSTNKDVELGISKVAEYLKIDPITKQPKWTISKHLTRAIEQIESYVWQQVRGGDGKFKSVPRKENDDACDSLRYFLFNYSSGYQDPEIQSNVNDWQDNQLRSTTIWTKTGW